jgi:hypothetical protein
MRRLAALVVLLLALVAAPSVGAQTSVAPPGNSGVDEYRESVPSAEGNRPSGDAVRELGADSALTPGVRRRLHALGADGRAAADVASATAPDEVRSRQRADGREGAPATTDGRAPAGGSSVAGALVDALGGSGGMGAALPVLLVVTVLGAAWAIVRRRPA